MEQTYRRTVELDREADYWHVEMGARDHLNGPASYPFPSVDGATAFAKSHKISDPDRDIVIVFPDGRRWDGKGWVHEERPAGDERTEAA